MTKFNSEYYSYEGSPMGDAGKIQVYFEDEFAVQYYGVGFTYSDNGGGDYHNTADFIIEIANSINFIGKTFNFRFKFEYLVDDVLTTEYTSWQTGYTFNGSGFAQEVFSNFLINEMIDSELAGPNINNMETDSFTYTLEVEIVKANGSSIVPFIRDAYYYEFRETLQADRVPLPF